jgi:hypothetical protein
MAEIKHESLELEGLWRLTWVGKLTQNPFVSCNDLRLRVYLSKLIHQDADDEIQGTISGPLTIDPFSRNLSNLSHQQKQ